MKLFEELQAVLREHQCTDFAEIISQASLSACSKGYGVNLCEISHKLDMSNKMLIVRLMSITQEPDFDNNDQSEMMDWLGKNGWEKIATKYKRC